MMRGGRTMTMPDERPSHNQPSPDDAFHTTRWSLIGRAGADGVGATALRGEALSEVLRRYVPAMRSHLVARLRIEPELADDLLQGFIVRKILEYDLLSRASPARGKFRTLLLTSLGNYVRTELGRRARHTGSDLEPVAENLPDDGSGEPGADFDVPWARAIISEAIERMRAECNQSGRDDIWGVFDARILGPTLRDEPPLEYAQLIQRFGYKSPAQASNVLMTAKRTFERILRSLVAEYAESDEQIDAEIADLRDVLSRVSSRP
jgi:DNA-directed RNA polymerase specialized sigma24 family protein